MFYESFYQNKTYYTESQLKNFKKTVVAKNIFRSTGVLVTLNPL